MRRMVLTALLLAGVWNSPCYLDSWNYNDNQKGQSAAETYTFKADGTFSYTDTWYTDDKCQNVGLVEGNQTGTFEVKEAANDNGFFTIPNGISEVDFHVVAGSVTGYDRSLILTNSDAAPTSFQIGRGMMASDPKFTMRGMNPSGTVFTKQ